MRPLCTDHRPLARPARGAPHRALTLIDDETGRAYHGAPTMPETTAAATMTNKCASLVCVAARIVLLSADGLARWRSSVQTHPAGIADERAVAARFEIQRGSDHDAFPSPTRQRVFNAITARSRLYKTAGLYRRRRTCASTGSAPPTCSRSGIFLTSRRRPADATATHNGFPCEHRAARSACDRAPDRRRNKVNGPVIAPSPEAA